MRARVRTANYAKIQGRPSGWNTKRAAAAPPGPRRLELGQSVNRNSWGARPDRVAILAGCGRVLAASACLCAFGPAADMVKNWCFRVFWPPKSDRKMTPQKKSVILKKALQCVLLRFFGHSMTLLSIFHKVLYTCAYMGARMRIHVEYFYKMNKKCQLINKNGFILRSIGVFG